MERDAGRGGPHEIDGVPLSRHLAHPQASRAARCTPHPVMSADEIGSARTATWTGFYGLPRVWERSKAVRSLKGRLAFVLMLEALSPDVRNTGIATDSARTARSVQWARPAWPSRAARLFAGTPLPDLQVPA